MFTIALSANPKAVEIRRAMEIMGYIAGGSVMNEVAGGMIPTPPAPAAPSAESVFTPQPPAPIPPAPLAGPVELDSKGFPWTAEIHAGTKTRNKDGSWKAKKGVDAALVTATESALRFQYPAPVAGAAPIPPASMPLPPAPAPIPPAPIAAGPLDFIGLMGKISAHVNGGKLTQADVAAECQKVGVMAVPLLAQRPDLIPSVGAALDALAMSR